MRRNAEICRSATSNYFKYTNMNTNCFRICIFKEFCIPELEVSLFQMCVQAREVLLYRSYSARRSQQSTFITIQSGSNLILNIRENRPTEQYESTIDHDKHRVREIE